MVLPTLTTVASCATPCYGGPEIVSATELLAWAQLFPRLAKHFGMAYAPPQQMSLSAAMPALAGVWQRLVQRHDLVPTPFEQLVGWDVGDFLFHHEADNITSTAKIRQAGFADALDTETRLPQLFDALVQQKVLPPFPGARARGQGPE